jgi:hypothetical protein
MPMRRQGRGHVAWSVSRAVQTSRRTRLQTASRAFRNPSNRQREGVVLAAAGLCTSVAHLDGARRGSCDGVRIAGPSENLSRTSYPHTRSSRAAVCRFGRGRCSVVDR